MKKKKLKNALVMITDRLTALEGRIDALASALVNPRSFVGNQRKIGPVRRLESVPPRPGLDDDTEAYIDSIASEREFLDSLSEGLKHQETA